MRFNDDNLDIYRKVPKDLTQPTTTGAIISISSILFIAFLVISEALSFFSTEFISQMYVTDPKLADERIYVRVSLLIPYMQCKYLGVDIQDDMGRHEVGHVEDVVKLPLIRDDGEGCTFRASFRINKVPGNFHIATHSAKERPQSGNMLHAIEYVAFGDDVPNALANVVPGSFNSLQNITKMDPEASPATHDYFIKVVPSSIELISGKTYHPYQYTYAYRNYIGYGHGGQVMPAIWFRYDLSPITVTYTERRRPFYHFLTMFCAIIGGTFTVASIIDSMIFTTHNWFKKAEIGKLG